MSYSYIYQSAQKITLGWGDEAKETPFGGLTWSGHFSGVAAYEGALDRVAVLEMNWQALEWSVTLNWLNLVI